MNSRQWKKACKKAAAELERRWPGEYEIVPARGDEAVYAPHRYEPPHRRSLRTVRGFADPPRGLPGVWECSGYESIECDFRDALGALRFRESIEDTDWEAEADLLMGGTFTVGN